MPAVNELLERASPDSYAWPGMAGVRRWAGVDGRDGGLVATSGTLKGFAIAGADGSFVWAKAQLSGNKVIVQSPDVPAPGGAA